MIQRKYLYFIIFTLFIIGIAVYAYFPENEIPNNCTIDKILVLKSKRKLEVFAEGKLIKTYSIALGKEPIGKKQFEGDNKTPEGQYYIYDKNQYSKFHKTLGISYPNKEDIKFAKQAKRLPGGDVKIHGLKDNFGILSKFHSLKDWTAGCIALTNTEIDELYEHVPLGTPIEIRP